MAIELGSAADTRDAPGQCLPRAAWEPDAGLGRTARRTCDRLLDQRDHDDREPARNAADDD